VFLTDKVEPLIEKIKLVGIEVRESALKGISASERQQLTDLLSRMRANLCAQDADTK
jgi:DNA-binding MarR family transcriptional regulator